MGRRRGGPGGPGRGAAGPGRRRGRRRQMRRVRRRTRRRRIIVGGAIVMMVGGAYSSYKVSTAEADQIEQHVGKSVDDMSEEEFEGAMDDLGIQDQELTAEDEAAIEAEAV